MTSMWGEEYDNRTAEFNNQVDMIELKHFEVFKDRINRISGESPDTLHHHFMTVKDSGSIQIKFPKDSYVPKYILDEVETVFIAVFSRK